MTYAQLLPIYQQATGLPGSDDAFNQWVQKAIDASGSQTGIDGIPDNFYQTSAGQAILNGSAPQQPPATQQPPQQNGGGVTPPTLPPAAPTITTFYNSNPAYAAEYNRVKAAGDPRTADQWMADYIAQSPQDQAKYNAFQQDTSSSGTVPFNSAPVPAINDGNYNQVQNAVQGGQFSTVDNSTQQQNQTTSQNTTGSQTGSSQQNTSSSSTSTPVDTLGLGSLITQQAGETAQSDAARNSWLSDLMQTGGTGFNGQIDQAVRSSLSGPQMSGAGESAQARAAGYAAADTGRNNLNQRLAASQQLGGSTGLSSLVGASNGYLGQTNNTSGSADSITNMLNSTNTTGLSNLISKSSDATAGSTTAQSSQAGAGTIPQGQPVKSGGCVLCTAALDLGLSNHRRVLRAVINHKLNVDWIRFRLAARGYFAFFTPLAAWLLSHPRIAKLLWPLAKAVVYEELRVAGRRLPLRKRAWLVHWTGHFFCSLVGRLPVKGYVTDARITTIAKRENIYFVVKA